MHHDAGAAQPLVEAVTDRVSNNPQLFENRQLATMLWAFAALARQQEGSVAFAVTLADEVLERVDRLGPQDTAMVLQMSGLGKGLIPRG